MKKEVLNLQKKKYNLDCLPNGNTNKLSNIGIDKKECASTSFNSSRKWEKTITIEERLQLSISQQLDRIKYEYKAYDNQEKKFQDTINDINNNKEKFYPKESKALFKEYIKLIKDLKINLKSMETNLKKHKK